MMCNKYNRWFRVGEGCPFCKIEQMKLDFAVFAAERENAVPIVLWEGNKT